MPPRRDDDDDDALPDEDAPVALPIDGVLDLHTFAPREAKELVAEYLEACFEAGLDEVRLIHGKGTGQLRRLVEAQLAKHPRVESFHPASEAEGGWGATIARLRRCATRGRSS